MKSLGDPWILRYRSLLSLLSFVTWDRFTESSAFGWIDRHDGRADFVALVNAKEGVYSVTSSAERSADIGRLLYEWHGAKWSAEKHRPCRRIEDVLPDLVNVVRLEMSGGADV